MQHFLGQPARQGFKHGFYRLALVQHFSGAVDLQAAPLISLRIELLYQWHRATLVEPVHEVLHAGVNDHFGLRHSGLPMFFAGLHHLGQIVHGVEKNVLERLHFGLDVTGYRQIDHEHGPVLALLERAFHRAQADDGQAAGSATDHSVKFMQALWQIAQSQYFSPKAPGQFFAALQRAVGNRQGLRVFRSEMGGRQLNHFTGTHKQDPDVRQILKELTGQAHRGRCHADAVGANVGVTAHVLGHRKRALEQLLQRSAYGAGVFCCAHRVFHLAEDLRLAQHHGVQPAGHAKSMACSLVVVQCVAV